MKNLKTIITVLALLLSTVLFSQVSLQHGTVNEDGSLNYITSDYIESEFDYRLNNSRDAIICIIDDNGEELEVAKLKWDIISMDTTESAILFIVRDRDGVVMILSFLTESNVVLIIDSITKGFSSMTGEGVHYEKLI